VAVFKETASGADNGRPERAKVLALARARKIDAILVTELSRWGRSTQDLVQTLDDLHGWKVSVLAQTGLSFDLSTASGKLMRTIMAGLAEFERDLIRDRVKSGLAAARARGVKLGRQVGQRPSDKKAKRVLGMHADGLSYRLIARNVGLSKNTVMGIVRRNAGLRRPGHAAGGGHGRGPHRDQPSRAGLRRTSAIAYGSKWHGAEDFRGCNKRDSFRGVQEMLWGRASA
jgi:putative DNA-invertase from lambdoid prophage Rac